MVKTITRSKQTLCGLFPMDCSMLFIFFVYFQFCSHLQRSYNLSIFLFFSFLFFKPILMNMFWRSYIWFKILIFSTLSSSYIFLNIYGKIIDTLSPSHRIYVILMLFCAHSNVYYSSCNILEIFSSYLIT